MKVPWAVPVQGNKGAAAVRRRAIVLINFA
jgi:hypothetical protein